MYYDHSYSHAFEYLNIEYCERLYPSVRPSVNHAISSETTGCNPTKLASHFPL